MRKKALFDKAISSPPLQPTVLRSATSARLNLISPNN